MIPAAIMTNKMKAGDTMRVFSILLLLSWTSGYFCLDSSSRDYTMRVGYNYMTPNDIHVYSADCIHFINDATFFTQVSFGEDCLADDAMNQKNYGFPMPLLSTEEKITNFLGNEGDVLKFFSWYRCKSATSTITLHERAKGFEIWIPQGMTMHSSELPNRPLKSLGIEGTLVLDGDTEITITGEDLLHPDLESFYLGKIATDQKSGLIKCNPVSELLPGIKGRNGYNLKLTIQGTANFMAGTIDLSGSNGSGGEGGVDGSVKANCSPPSDPYPSLECVKNGCLVNPCIPICEPVDSERCQECIRKGTCQAPPTEEENVGCSTCKCCVDTALCQSQNGDPGGNGGRGGDGGTLEIIHNGELHGSGLTVITNGGRGGGGGAGGQKYDGSPATQCGVVILKPSPNVIDGAAGYPMNGGDGGKITITSTGQSFYPCWYTASIFCTASGGPGGDGAYGSTSVPGATGGKGGDINVTINNPSCSDIILNGKANGGNGGAGGTQEYDGVAGGIGGQGGEIFLQAKRVTHTYSNYQMENSKLECNGGQGGKGSKCGKKGTSGGAGGNGGSGGTIEIHSETIPDAKYLKVAGGEGGVGGSCGSTGAANGAGGIEGSVLKNLSAIQSITLSADRQEAGVGEVVVYTVNVKNPFDSILENAQFYLSIDPLLMEPLDAVTLDPLTGEIKKRPSFVAPSGSTSFSFTLRVIDPAGLSMAADSVALRVLFEGSVNGAKVTEQSNALTTKIVKSASVKLTVDRTEIEMYDSLTLTAHIKNESSSSLTVSKIKLANPLSPDLDSIDYLVDPKTGIFLLDAMTVAPGSTVPVTVKLKSNEIAGRTYPITIPLRIICEARLKGRILSLESDRIDIKVNPASPFKLSADKEYSYIGDSIQYTVAIKNSSSDSMQNIIVETTPLDPCLELVESTDENIRFDEKTRKITYIYPDAIPPKSAYSFDYFLNVKKSSLISMKDDSLSVSLQASLQAKVNGKDVSMQSNRVETKIYHVEIQLTQDRENLGVGEEVVFTAKISNYTKYPFEITQLLSSPIESPLEAVGIPLDPVSHRITATGVPPIAAHDSAEFSFKVKLNEPGKGDERELESMAVYCDGVLNGNAISIGSDFLVLRLIYVGPLQCSSEKTDSYVGDAIPYTISFMNNSNDPVENIVVETTPIDARLSLVESSEEDIKMDAKTRKIIYQFSDPVPPKSTHSFDFYLTVQKPDASSSGDDYFTAQLHATLKGTLNGDEFSIQSNAVKTRIFNIETVLTQDKEQLSIGEAITFTGKIVNYTKYPYTVDSLYTSPIEAPLEPVGIPLDSLTQQIIVTGIPPVAPFGSFEFAFQIKLNQPTKSEEREIDSIAAGCDGWLNTNPASCSSDYLPFSLLYVGPLQIETDADYSYIGDAIHYTVKVKNSTKESLHDFTVQTSPIDAQLSLVESSDDDIAMDATTRKITYRFPDPIPPESTHIFDFYLSVNEPTDASTSPAYFTARLQAIMTGSLGFKGLMLKSNVVETKAFNVSIQMAQDRETLTIGDEVIYNAKILNYSPHPLEISQVYTSAIDPPLEPVGVPLDPSSGRIVSAGFTPIPARQSTEIYFKLKLNKPAKPDEREIDSVALYCDAALSGNPITFSSGFLPITLLYVGPLQLSVNYSRAYPGDWLEYYLSIPNYTPYPIENPTLVTSPLDANLRPVQLKMDPSSRRIYWTLEDDLPANDISNLSFLLDVTGPEAPLGKEINTTAYLRVSLAGTVGVNSLNLVSGFLPVTLSSIRLGDVDGNQKLTAKDVQLLYLFAWGKATPSENQLLAGDVDKDGEITEADAKLVYDTVLKNNRF